jgi:O-acetyl-ADP-ribose deacetylase (regulator of RNase III)
MTQTPRLRTQQGDITRLQVDAVVNAANRLLLPGGGVCGAIHWAAGPRLALACLKEAPCPAGQARLTPGFGLPARFVIHAVGPVWKDGTRGEEDLLASCYRESLRLAEERSCRSIAFPAISTGIFGFPADRAARIAVRECRAFLAAHALPEEVVLVAFDAASLSHLETALAETEP